MTREVQTIALYDANNHGHHPTYQILITKLLLEYNYAVWLVCSGIEEVITCLRSSCSNEMMKRLDCMPVQPVPKGNFLRRRFWGVRNWKKAANSIEWLVRKKGHDPDLVFFLKVDDFAKGILTGRWVDRFFQYSWSGIYIHLRFPEKYKLTYFRKRIYQPFSVFSSKRCKIIGTLQEDAVDQFTRITSTPIAVLPDLTDVSPPVSNQLTEEILKKAEGRKIVGLIGGQDRRKGSFLLFQIAQHCVHKKNWFFIFVGKMNYEKSDQELDRLKGIIGDQDNWGNCFFHFERLPNENYFNAVVDICDVIFAVYQKFPFSSNIMTKAAFFQKPIVVSSGGLMAQRVKKYGLGTICEPNNVDDCIHAIEKVIEHPPSGANHGRYFNQHSEALFLSKFQYLIKKGLA